MEQRAVPTQRAKSSVLKLLQHRIVPTRFLRKRSTIDQDNALAQGFRDRAERGPIADLQPSTVVVARIAIFTSRVRTHDRWDPLNLLAQWGPIAIREMMTELASSTFPDHDTWRARLLNYVDEHATQIVTDLAGLVRMPSVSGSDNEIEIQHLLSDRMVNMDLDVDTWQ